ncbi:hypothetical protein E2C01_058722 [Portunus trituberculatus]|uniref:Uncharacterized protein n=1 Tax=Portunus trituberculatus TaxID=210409 RepID=A0A5B7H6Y6_PORTR|nr:hypothetical protein [Portunus trituberculatus]
MFLNLPLHTHTLTLPFIIQHEVCTNRFYFPHINLPTKTMQGRAALTISRSLTSGSRKRTLFSPSRSHTGVLQRVEAGVGAASGRSNSGGMTGGM